MAAPDPAPAPGASAPVDRVVARPPRATLVPVAVFLAGTVPLAVSSPWLLWLLLLPLAWGLWVVRARVVAAPVGLLVCNGLTTTRVTWSQVDGFDVRRNRWTRLLLKGGRRVPLTALRPGDLPRILAVGERAAAS